MLTENRNDALLQLVIVSSCLFSFLILATSWPKLKSAIIEFYYVLNFFVTFLLLTTNTALYFSARMIPMV